ncbi:hypothetical protein [Cellulosimicrobium marinum]|uniref:hypothetical protein n=1 Tax=Cellulosimicrobium marinum TaxID=1638992 RepID=UPI001E57CF2A|nr:hypothetical protein [Cellulosimicrobium marinum]MCB7136321.1 hypothetical protein [Cellulosimicrobium marinum]
MSVPDVARSPAVLAGPFARRAVARRDRYNAVLARAVAHGAERDVVADAVRDVARAVDPLADRLDGPAFAATCDAVLDAVARLAATRRWRQERARSTPEQHVLVDVVPSLVPWLVVAPGVTVAAAVDAARALDGGAGSRGDLAGWSARVVAAAHAGTAVTAETVRGAVLVAAWRSGLVRYRRAALDAARSLPETVARAALSLGPGTAPDVAGVLDRHATDPWWWPGEESRARTAVTLPGVHGAARVLGRFGGFRGFGGPWLSPAVVVGTDARHPGLRWHLLADDAGTTTGWTLVADVHGSLVARTAGGVEPGVAHRDDAQLLGPGAGVPAPRRETDLADVTGTASLDTPSGRLLLLSRSGSYDVVLVRWDR